MQCMVITREMLARVLLTLHNLHHYQAFFVALQSAIRFKLTVWEEMWFVQKGYQFGTSGMASWMS